MQPWTWVTFIAVWFVLGPLFVMLFTTLGLEYYANADGTSTRARRSSARGRARVTPPLGAQHSGMAHSFLPATPSGQEPAAALPAGLEQVWWTERPDDRTYVRRASGGD